MTFAHYEIGWRYPGTPSEKLVLLALAEHSDADGLAFPGYTRLARITGLHRSTVVRCVAELEARGFVVVTRTTTRDGKTRNRYRLVAQRDQSQDATSSKRRHDQSRDATRVVAPCDPTSRTVIPEPTNEPTSEPTNEPTRDELLNQIGG